MKKTVIAGLFALSAGAAIAHTGATGIVLERMEGMKSLASSMKALVGMAKTGAIDPDQITQHARSIQAHSGQAMLTRFPEGSLPMVSEAAPAIWADWDGFSKISQDLFDTAIQLEAEASNPDLNLNAYVATFGQTCKSCHEDYRIEK